MIFFAWAMYSSEPMVMRFCSLVRRFISARICLTEASTSVPLMKMVTLRVLDFAITDVLAKMVQTSVTGWDG